MNVDDARECARWMTLNRDENCASIECLKPCAFFKISGIFYLPVKLVLMAESIAPNPNVTGTKRLLAIRRAMNDLRKMYPHTEIYFLSKGNTKLDEAAEFYGFSELSFKVYRLRPSEPSKARKYRMAEAPEKELRHHA